LLNKLLSKDNKRDKKGRKKHNIEGKRLHHFFKQHTELD